MYLTPWQEQRSNPLRPDQKELPPDERATARWCPHIPKSETEENLLLLLCAFHAPLRE